MVLLFAWWVSTAARADALVCQSHLRILEWSQPSEQPPGVFEIELDVTSTDWSLWELSLRRGGRECGKFELFDARGERIARTNPVIGHRYGVNIRRPLFALLDAIDADPSLARARSIRFTHTHPRRRFQIGLDRIGTLEPRVLSEADVRAGTAVRDVLDERRTRCGVGLARVDFVMAAFYAEYSTFALLRDPRTWRGDARAARRDLAWTHKPAVIYPGR